MKNETEKQKTWWQTLPGILTAASGLLVAVTGLIGVLIQAGLLGTDDPSARLAQEQMANPPAESAPASSPEPASPIQGQSAASDPGDTSTKTVVAGPPDKAASKPRPMKGSEAVFTTVSGETARVNAASLYLGYSEDDKTLPLTSGQSVDFDKIRTIEVLSVEHTDRYKTYPDEAGDLTVRVLLLSGETLTGNVAMAAGGLPYFFFSASSNLGDFRIRPWKVTAIRFER